MNLAVESFVLPGARRAERSDAVALNISLLKMMSLRVDRLSGADDELRAAAWRWLESETAVATCAALKVDHKNYLAQLRAKAGVA